MISTNKPYYVAFDSENSHLYWTEHGSSGKIMRCNSDGSHLTTIVNESRPTALTLDTKNRLFYLLFVVECLAIDHLYFELNRAFDFLY